jgi:fimbrial chaperone protein
MTRHLRVAAASSIVLAAAASTYASDFTVNPMQVVLSPTVRSAVVAIHNTSTEVLRFQISAFAWDQDERGAMKLDADGARALVVFPQLVTLPAGVQKQIRIGTDTRATDAEVSYRLFFEELPSSTAKPANGVQVRTRLSLPVFVRPAGAVSAAVQISGFHGAQGKITLKIGNSGKSHVALDKIVVHGTDSAGKTVYTRELPGWYVLANRSTTYELPITGAECAASSFVATLVIGTKTVKDQFTGQVPDCR